MKIRETPIETLMEKREILEKAGIMEEEVDQ
jgi:hypothetical protein